MIVRVSRVPRPNVVQPVEVPEGADVSALLAKMGAFPDAVVVLRDGTPIPLDARVKPDEELKVVSVFSGG